MKYHAHKTDEQWQVFADDTPVFTLPAWVPFSVVNELVRGLTRTDSNGFVTEARTGINPVYPEDN
jgi:hypothetical protein